LSSVSKAVENRIAYVTEDRKTYGLNLIDHIKHNVTLANLSGVSSRGVIDDMREMSVANDYRKKTNIRASSVYQLTGNLSGGNQQKVVLSKWLFADPEVLILDEPTTGLDATVEAEVLDLIAQLRRELSASILFISHKFDEIYRIADRYTVFRDGEMVGEGLIKHAGQSQIVRMMVGRSVDHIFPQRKAEIGAPVLSVSGLSHPTEFRDIG
ncbi:sugar ABC transporter ATP-binding protein, partial [bacterium M00.F.Ca.ET.229.01.1.1]